MKLVNITSKNDIGANWGWFAEFAFCLIDLLKERGQLYVISKEINPEALNIIIASAHHSDYYLECNLPGDSIIVNLEQFYNESRWSKGKYLELLSKYRVWDYSAYNVYWLQKYHNIKAELFRRMYSSQLDTVERLSRSQKDIDVLFFGTLDKGREAVKTALEYHPAINNVVFKFGVWGKERDHLIARSKIVLNIHNYSSIGIFEASRISRLLSNEAFVITEHSVDDHDYRQLDGGLVRVERSEIVRTVVKYLENPEERERIAKIGYEAVKNFKNVTPEF